MATAEQILEVLVGKKVFTGRQWVSYDETDTPLVDAGGVLWKGVHGALLWGALFLPAAVPLPDAGGGGGGRHHQVESAQSSRHMLLLQQAHEEDEILLALLHVVIQEM